MTLCYWLFSLCYDTFCCLLGSAVLTESFNSVIYTWPGEERWISEENSKYLMGKIKLIENKWNQLHGRVGHSVKPFSPLISPLSVHFLISFAKLCLKKWQNLHSLTLFEGAPASLSIDCRVRMVCYVRGRLLLHKFGVVITFCCRRHCRLSVGGECLALSFILIDLPVPKIEKSLLNRLLNFGSMNS